MLTQIVTHLCDVKLETPKGTLDLRLELIAFRRTIRQVNDGQAYTEPVRRRLQVIANYGERRDYVAHADVTDDIDRWPTKAEDLVIIDVVADLIKGVVEGLLEKANNEGERTGNATLGPPTHLTAQDLDHVLRQLVAERQILEEPQA